METAAATCALICGTGGRNENEKTYLDVALTILGSVTMSDTEEEGACVCVLSRRHGGQMKRKKMAVTEREMAYVNKKPADFGRWFCEG